MGPKKSGQSSEPPANPRRRELLTKATSSGDKPRNKGNALDEIGRRRANLSPAQLELVDLKYNTGDDLHPLSK